LRFDFNEDCKVIQTCIADELKLIVEEKNEFLHIRRSIQETHSDIGAFFVTRQQMRSKQTLIY
jgi:hypothetical protein